MEFSPIAAHQLLAVYGVILLGAVLQAATGLGTGLLIVPLLALIDPVTVPGPIVFASIAISGLMAWRGRREFRIASMNFAVLGMAAGALAAAAVVSVIQTRYAGLLIGGLILLAVAASVVGLRVRVTPVNELLAGGLAGFTGTVAAVGAPILALLYQHEHGPRVRAKLAYLYLFGALAAITVLHLSGLFGLPQLLLGLGMMPAYVVGFLVSGRLAAFLDRGYTRAAILVISGGSAMIVMGRSLMAVLG